MREARSLFESCRGAFPTQLAVSIFAKRIFWPWLISISKWILIGIESSHFEASPAWCSCWLISPGALPHVILAGDLNCLPDTGAVPTLALARNAKTGRVMAEVQLLLQGEAGG